MAGLARIGADAARVPAYLTTPGLPGDRGLDACAAERGMLEAGDIDAIVFSSTAEARARAWLALCRDQADSEGRLRRPPPAASAARAWHAPHQPRAPGARRRRACAA
jgi:hypothetical protein